MLNKTTKQDSPVQKSTHNNATKDKIAQYGSAQYKRAQSKEQNRIFCRKGSPVLSNQLYFNITSETQSLVSFYHSVSQRLFATEAPCLPVTSTLGPRHVKTVPISCRIHLLHRMLTDSILFSLNPFVMTKKVKRSGRKEAEGKTKMKRIGRYREMERDSGRERKTRGKRELVGAATPVS